jgi:hypothetical protein
MCPGERPRSLSVLWERRGFHAFAAGDVREEHGVVVAGSRGSSIAADDLPHSAIQLGRRAKVKANLREVWHSINTLENAVLNDELSDSRLGSWAGVDSVRFPVTATRGSCLEGQPQLSTR